MKTEFTPPKDPALRALWIIRNWTNNRGNMQSAEDILRKVAELSSNVFDELYSKGMK